ncbi:MAG: NAD(P)-dependent oxidoreductase [Bacteroidales bacterium]|nr:NAD(P)-dependent oxidoreductase [Bacteroidales bacterium]
MRKKTILLTGATGNMGSEGLKQLYAHRDKYHIVILALPSREDRKRLANYKNNDSISIVWGDLTNYQDVQKAVCFADIVLHVGALVSPMADRHPELAWKVNFEGTRNIVDALLSRPDKDQVKLVSIGTVAQTGNRPVPYHWGRIGDPLVPSLYDNYALSKIAAERYVIESGLKYWVSLRQTGILHENLLKMNDGIAYHQPLNNHLEWITAADSGKLLLNVCADDIPEDFWGKVYNIGGGEPCRLTAYQFTDKVYRMLGVDFRKLEDPNWYALRNFHGQYYYDSDLLNEYLHFRREGIDDMLRRLKSKLPLTLRLIPLLPKRWVKRAMQKKALAGNSPLHWIKHSDKDRIRAFLGSRNSWENIPGWDDFEIVVDPPSKKLEHGYNETKAAGDLALADMQQAAAFRGGQCLSISMKRGDLRTKLHWRCSQKHDFEASPYLILKTGHWCEECLKAPWSFDRIAKTNPFIAQIWHVDHPIKENNVYA